MGKIARAAIAQIHNWIVVRENLVRNFSTISRYAPKKTAETIAANPPLTSSVAFAVPQIQ